MNRLRPCFLALIALLSLAAPTAHAWPHPPNVNVKLPTAAYAVQPRIVSDGAGGYFAVFCDYRNFNFDIFVQHFDAAGRELWTPNGVALCTNNSNQYPETIIADGYGGVIAVWTDYRSDVSYGDLYARRVNSAGTPLWLANGVVVCQAAGQQANVKVVSDRSGGLYAAWADDRNVATNQRDVYLQRVNNVGTATLPPDGLGLCTLPGEQTEPDIATTASGEAYVVWTDNRSGNDIYGQYITSSGVTTLAANGSPLCTAGNSQFNPEVVALPNDRFLVAWSDFRSSISFDIYAQLVYAYSNYALLPFNGVPLCTATGNQYMMEVISDRAGGYVALWQDYRNGLSELRAQKLNAAGAAQWASDGVPVQSGEVTVSDFGFAADGMGGVLVAWGEARVDVSDLYAQRLRPDGTPAWGVRGVPVCTADGQQYNPAIVASTNGGATLAWDDYRSAGSGPRMQGVDEWGYLGAEPVMADVRDIPNDQGGQVKLTWAASPLDYDAAFRNITAYTVFRSVPQALVSGLFAAGSATDEATSSDGRRYRRMQFSAQDYYWEELARITARHVTAYSYLAATEGDSIGGSNPVTVYMVGAETLNGTNFWFSQPDSGYSVDNLAPAAPAPLTGLYSAGSTRLYWNPNTEADLAGYRLYRGTTQGFVPSEANLVAAVSDTGHVDAAGTPYYYKLTAIDAHGNESPVATLSPGATLDAPGATPARAFFAAPQPNPLRAGANATLRFGLAQAGVVRLALHDAQGRAVRVLAEGVREAGEHAVAVVARDASGRVLPPGLYLARLTAPGLAATQRLVVIE